MQMRLADETYALWVPVIGEKLPAIPVGDSILVSSHHHSKWFAKRAIRQLRYRVLQEHPQSQRRLSRSEAQGNGVLMHQDA